jgi:predicted GH43/DUF377 family glycosyl hydrolase
MAWTKLGLIFCPDNNFDWMRTHAAGPVAEHIGDNRFRIYFGCRDSANRTSIGCLEIDINQPQRILALSRQPIVAPGEVGLFDDSGASMGCLVQDGLRRYLYYLGWNLSVTVPWRNSIGLATSSDRDAAFTKVSRAPLIDRSDVDPFTLTYPWVMHDHGRWKMWYGSSLKWGPNDADMAHVIKYAESADGIHWQRTGAIAIDLKSKDEYAIVKPCVLRYGSLYRMWYSYRGVAPYRIGYAESRDGLQWSRKDDEAGIAASGTGWDSESVAYAHVFRHGRQLYMLYNGNGYGRTGFGLAISRDEHVKADQ